MSSRNGPTNTRYLPGLAPRVYKSLPFNLAPRKLENPHVTGYGVYDSRGEFVPFPTTHGVAIENARARERDTTPANMQLYDEYRRAHEYRYPINKVKEKIDLEAKLIVCLDQLLNPFLLYSETVDYYRTTEPANLYEENKNGTNIIGEMGKNNVAKLYKLKLLHKVKATIDGILSIITNLAVKNVEIVTALSVNAKVSELLRIGPESDVIELSKPHAPSENNCLDDIIDPPSTFPGYTFHTSAIIYKLCFIKALCELIETPLHNISDFPGALVKTISDFNINAAAAKAAAPPAAAAAAKAESNNSELGGGRRHKKRHTQRHKRNKRRTHRSKRR